MIIFRPGVEDVSLGNSLYAQVRVQVGGGHYLKGMAMYKEGLPFGSVIRRQILADRGTDKERVSSAMNIVNEEGDWADWARTISAQVLSKQPRSLARERLNKTQERRKNEFDEIMGAY